MHSQLTRWRSWSKAERWLLLLNNDNDSIFPSLIVTVVKKQKQVFLGIYRLNSVALKKPQYSIPLTTSNFWDGFSFSDETERERERGEGVFPKIKWAP